MGEWCLILFLMGFSRCLIGFTLGYAVIHNNNELFIQRDSGCL